ncbi:MAG: ABC transporter ATP-binding protein [Winogradskyella sp.]|uniref:ABC transporter ATP-binding protein n=1 Tax=Winogradskyella sp. TaxID=1883156 RepID=UPI00385FFF82
MLDIILKAEHISKQYRLGVIGTGTLSHDLKRWSHKIRGKEDPYLKIGDVNNRSKKGETDYVWALKDISFEVKRGEILGIIGKNGAGKSTLLKILSRVTGPTSGVIKTRGRIASLLEVGTGFHPELTGKENIYLNGAILGMTKAEIKAKEHEIIEFSGCERYIETPVKRYSSGMRVRLAFAVAAFLEPDILVIDEVLAVGDAEFQKKAIGKMQDISKGEGRTVLFVSHDLTAVQNLCHRCLLLEDGKIKQEGDVTTIINSYIISNDGTSPKFMANTKHGDCQIELLNSNLEPSLDFKIGEKMHLKFLFNFNVEVPFANIGIGINTLRGTRVVTYHTKYEVSKTINIKDKTEIICTVDDIILINGTYNIEVSLFENQNYTFYNNGNVFALQILGSDFYKTGKLPNSNFQGVVVQKSKWTINEL